MKQRPNFAIFAFNSDTPNGGCGDLYDSVGTLESAVVIAKKAIREYNNNVSLNESFDTAQILCLTRGKIVAHINRYSDDKSINQQLLNYLTSQIR